MEIKVQLLLLFLGLIVMVECGFKYGKHCKQYVRKRYRRGRRYRWGWGCAEYGYCENLSESYYKWCARKWELANDVCKTQKEITTVYEPHCGVSYRQLTTRSQILRLRNGDISREACQRQCDMEGAHCYGIEYTSRNSHDGFEGDLQFALDGIQQGGRFLGDVGRTFFAGPDNLNRCLALCVDLGTLNITSPTFITDEPFTCTYKRNRKRKSCNIERDWYWTNDHDCKQCLDTPAPETTTAPATTTAAPTCEGGNFVETLGLISGLPAVADASTLEECQAQCLRMTLAECPGVNWDSTSNNCYNLDTTATDASVNCGSTEIIYRRKDPVTCGIPSDTVTEDWNLRAGTSIIGGTVQEGRFTQYCCSLHCQYLGNACCAVDFGPVNDLTGTLGGPCYVHGADTINSPEVCQASRNDAGNVIHMGKPNNPCSNYANCLNTIDGA